MYENFSLLSMKIYPFIFEVLHDDGKLYSAYDFGCFKRQINVSTYLTNS